MLRSLVLSLLSLLLLTAPLCAQPAASDLSPFSGVDVQRVPGPIDFAAAARALEAEAAESGTMTKDNEPHEGFWFIPLYVVEPGAASNATIWSARNEEEGPSDSTSVVATYYDLQFNPLIMQSVFLEPDQLASVNVRDVDGLPAGGDGVLRGIIRLQSNPPSDVSVDVFQVDGSNDFATGSTAFQFPDDFCQNWQGRFLDFGGDSGSIYTFYVNGPRGADGGAPPTVMANVYNQQGNLLDSFEFRTDLWSFQFDARSLVPAGSRFGAMEFFINVQGGGVMSVAHNAFGRFSVGTPGICKD